MPEHADTHEAGEFGPGRWGTELWNRLIDAGVVLRRMRLPTDGCWVITTARRPGLCRRHAEVRYDAGAGRLSVRSRRVLRWRAEGEWAGLDAARFDEVVEAVKRAVG